MAFQLLLVEDDAELREIIEDYLMKRLPAFLTDSAKTGEECLLNALITHMI